MNLEFAGAGAPAAGSRPNLFARAAVWMQAYRYHRREMRQLQAMDAHMLADLGITRAQAENMAQQPYVGDWSGHSSRAAKDSANTARNTNPKNSEFSPNAIARASC